MLFVSDIFNITPLPYAESRVTKNCCPTSGTERGSTKLNSAYDTIDNYDALTRWVQPQHLGVQAIEYLKSLSKQELNAGVFLDDFLKEECFTRLQQVVEKEAEFKILCQIYSNKNNIQVSEEEFYSYAEKERFYHIHSLCGVKPEYRMSINWLTYLKFLHDYKLGMAVLLGNVIGSPLCSGNNLTHTLRQHNKLETHNDYLPGRRICTILYLSNEWSPQYCANLVMLNKENNELKEINCIDHKPNRLVIFSVDRSTFHYVSAFSELAKDKERSSMVFWFNDGL